MSLLDYIVSPDKLRPEVDNALFGRIHVVEVAERLLEEAFDNLEIIAQQQDRPIKWAEKSDFVGHIAGVSSNFTGGESPVVKPEASTGELTEQQQRISEAQDNVNRLFVDFVPAVNPADEYVLRS